MDNAKNFAKVTVDGPYDDVVTSVNLITGDGAKLPTAPFNAVWWNATDYPDPADDPSVEIVRVTAIATDALTVSRGEETAAFEHQLGGKLYRMAAGLTAKTINDEIAQVLGSGNTIITVDPDTDVIGVQTHDLRAGDWNGLGNNTKLLVDDNSSAAQLQCSGITAVGDVDGSGLGFIIDAPNGQIKALSLPTSNPTVAGALWNDGGTLKISAG